MLGKVREAQAVGCERGFKVELLAPVLIRAFAALSDKGFFMLGPNTGSGRTFEKLNRNSPK